MAKNRKPTAAPPLTTRGKAADTVRAANRWRDSLNPLRGLTMALAVSRLEAGDRGEYADLQWTYRLVEKRNATLRALIARRSAALLKLDWDIKIPDVLPAGVTQAEADAQAKTLRAFYDRITNFRCALKHLALAEFRGYSHLQIKTDGDGEEAKAGFGPALATESPLCLEPLNQWHWVRNGSDGDWYWNEEARQTNAIALGETNHADPREWGLVIRECERPINELGLICHLREGLGEKDWTAFIEIYGVPGGVVIMPPGVPAGQESDYEDAASAVAEGGSGALPNGSTYTANDGPRGTDPFSGYLEYWKEQLVLAGTSGKLTMLAESGSGTLAGGAHADTFDDLAEAEAGEISDVLNECVSNPVLDAKHPGKPHVAYFELAAEAKEDLKALADNVGKLHSAGFDAEAEELSEKFNLKLTRAEGARDLSRRTPEDSGPPEDPTADPSPDAPLRNRATDSRAKLYTALDRDLAPIRDRIQALDTLIGTIGPEGATAVAQVVLRDLDQLQREYNSRLAPGAVQPSEAALAFADLYAEAMARGLSERR